MKTIGVKFENTAKVYTYACEDDSVSVGNYVVTESAYGQFFGMSIGKVVRVDTEISPVATKYIVCIIDLAAYTARKERETKKVVIQKQLDTLVAKQQKLVIYESFAKTNPEMASLVAELKALL